MFKPKYEYKIETIESGNMYNVIEKLSSFDNDGWKLITYQDYDEGLDCCVLFFKRKIPIWTHLTNFLSNIDWFNLENKINEFPNSHIHGK